MIYSTCTPVSFNGSFFFRSTVLCPLKNRIKCGAQSRAKRKIKIHSIALTCSKNYSNLYSFFKPYAQQAAKFLRNAEGDLCYDPKCECIHTKKQRKMCSIPFFVKKRVRAWRFAVRVK